LAITIISIVISVAAFGLSVFTWRERRSNDKRDLFLRLHERLIDDDFQRGRRILTRLVQSSEEIEELVRERSRDYEMVSRTLSMLDVAALYVKQGYIDKQLFMEEWGTLYLSLREKFLILLAERAKTDNRSYMWSWPHFQALADDAYAQARSSDP
jgi:hypothetical protein